MGCLGFPTVTLAQRLASLRMHLDIVFANGVEDYLLGIFSQA